MCEWVSCDRCNKWRRLPPTMNPKQLPEKWVCNMNFWDSTTSDCSAPEEVHLSVRTPPPPDCGLRPPFCSPLCVFSCKRDNMNPETYSVFLVVPVCRSHPSTKVNMVPTTQKCPRHWRFSGPPPPPHVFTDMDSATRHHLGLGTGPSSMEVEELREDSRLV